MKGCFLKTLTRLARRNEALYVLLFVVVFLPVGVALPDDQQASGLAFEVDVIAGMDRYIDLLVYPPYLAVALENSGIHLDSAESLRILDPHTLQIESLHGSTLKFVRPKGPLFTYQTKVRWRVPLLSTGFEIPVEVDVSEIGKGRVAIRIYSAVAQLLPQSFTEGIQHKAQELLSVGVQRKLLKYLNGLRQKGQKEIGIQEMAQLILLQAYNHRGSRVDKAVHSRQYQDSEPLSDQVLLLITISIWFVAVPVTAILIFFWRRKYKP